MKRQVCFAKDDGLVIIKPVCSIRRVCSVRRVCSIRRVCFVQ